MRRASALVLARGLHGDRLFTVARGEVLGMNQRIVTVFGGTGFLGRAIVRRVAGTGARVRIAARWPEKAEFPGLSAQIERSRVDVREEEGVKAALHGAYVAVNSVSLYEEHGGLDFESIHVEGAARIARLARDDGVEQVVHISGIGVDPTSSSAYVRARARGEQRVREAFPNATVLRPSVLFGPGDSFIRTLDGLSRLPVIPLFGDGSVRLQPVYVEDVAEAVNSALGQPAGGAFELGGRDILSYREILRAVLRERSRRRLLLPVPFPIWRALAGIASLLPSPPLTRDQVALMQADNVVASGVRNFSDLHITPRGFRELLPDCLPGTETKV